VYAAIDAILHPMKAWFVAPLLLISASEAEGFMRTGMSGDLTTGYRAWEPAPAGVAFGAELSMKTLLARIRVEGGNRVESNFVDSHTWIVSSDLLVGLSLRSESAGMGAFAAITEDWPLRDDSRWQTFALGYQWDRRLFEEDRVAFRGAVGLGVGYCTPSNGPESCETRVGGPTVALDWLFPRGARLGVDLSLPRGMAMLSAGWAWETIRLPTEKR
jgi:hypothetical protein